MIHPNLTTDFGDRFSYNGVRFDNPLYKTKISGEPVRDDANRMVKCIRYTLETTAYVIAQGATDSTLANMRKKLTEPGKALIYRDKGFGDLIVNSPISHVRDVEWGPIPKLLTFVPIGNDQTALVNWRVMTSIPECDDAKYQFRLMAGCWSVEWDIDQQGYTSITYSGYIEIPLTFDINNLRRLRDNADAYRNQLFGTVPPFMKRETRKWKLSMDRRRLDFNVTDRQLPVVFPPGITYADVTHDVSSSLMERGFQVWENSIQGTLQVAPNEPKSLSWIRFRLIVLDRMRRAFEDAGTGRVVTTTSTTIVGGNDGVSKGIPTVSVEAKTIKTANILVTNYQFSEPLFKWESKFRVNYRIIGSGLDQILVHSGLWTTVAVTDEGSGAAISAIIQQLLASQGQDSVLASAAAGAGRVGASAAGAVGRFLSQFLGRGGSGGFGAAGAAAGAAGAAGALAGTGTAGAEIAASIQAGVRGAGSSADALAWLNSMKRVFNQRGVAGYAYNNADDALIDLCLNAASQTGAQVSPRTITLENPFIPPQGAEVEFQKGILQEAAGAARDDSWPEQDNSWIAWESAVEYTEDDHIVRHKPLSAKVTQAKPVPSATEKPSSSPNTHFQPRVQGDVPDILQRVCAPSNDLSLRGFAVRYGYRIAPPQLLTIQGKLAIQTGIPIVRERLVRVIGGVPIWRLDWVIDYTIGEDLTALPVPSSPYSNITGFDGTKTVDFFNPIAT